MTRVDFYFNAANKLEVVRKLAAKAFQAGQCALLFTRDESVAQDLDSGLWTMPSLSFLPHVRCGHPLAPQTPVLIGDRADELRSPDLLINLSPEWPPCFSRFERLIEVVTQESDDRQAARQRYRFYQERGYALNSVDLAGNER
jgi:DNA polymerase-3 subunit chi